MIETARLACIVISGALIGAGEMIPDDPRIFFRDQIGLTDDQIAMIDRGKAVAKVLPSETPGEIVIFGAILVKGSPAEYVKFAFDIDRLRRSPSYLGVAQFSDAPKFSDLGGFLLEPDDIKNLRNCRPGNCKVQLSAEAMQKLQEEVDWSAPGAGAQVNDRVRTMGLETLLRYQKAGDQSLGTYWDKDRPFHMPGQYEALLTRSQGLPVHLPELSHYLLAYPNASVTNVESLFFWEKVKFGLKPTLRLNHAMAYRSTVSSGGAFVVAIKQLYASHYFQIALDLTVCIEASGGNQGKGFYLITLKSSTQDGLTGFTGSILRRIVVSRARSVQENVLIGIKQSMEKDESMAKSDAQPTVE